VKPITQHKGSFIQMFNNAQQESFLNSPERAKALGHKPKAFGQDHDEQHDGEHEAAHAEHGPVVKTEMHHDHEMQEHKVTLHHADGHKRHSVHDSVREALDHIRAAHEADGEKSDEDNETADVE
jgi:hypothetical protein